MDEAVRRFNFQQLIPLARIFRFPCPDFERPAQVGLPINGYLTAKDIAQRVEHVPADVNTDAPIGHQNVPHLDPAQFHTGHRIANVKVPGATIETGMGSQAVKIHAPMLENLGSCVQNLNFLHRISPP